MNKRVCLFGVGVWISLLSLRGVLLRCGEREGTYKEMLSMRGMENPLCVCVVSLSRLLDMEMKRERETN